MHQLTCQKEAFSLEQTITYLNAAYMSPLLKKVEQVGYAGVSLKARPYHIKPAYFFHVVEDVKKSFSKLIEAEDPDRIAVIPSASYGVASVAQNIPLQKGDEIILVEEQFPSNYYTWAAIAKAAEAKVLTVKPTDENQRGASWNDALLAAINKKTAVVAMGHVHWADGLVFDLASIRAKTALVGAKLIIDGTQSVGALPFSVADFKPDALICAGYKWLLGPYTSGVMYVNESFDSGKPIEENWVNRLGSENFAQLVNYQDAYKPKAARYNMGEQSNFIALPMLTTALEQILSWTVAGINQYCEQIASSFLDRIQGLGCQVTEKPYLSSHLFGVRLPVGTDTHSLKAALEQEQIFVSIRGNAVRISPHLYNTEVDFEKLYQAFRSVLV